jgi:hypothetical protein
MADDNDEDNDEEDEDDDDMNVIKVWKRCYTEQDNQFK